jgi:hypothetical protein
LTLAFSLAFAASPLAGIDADNDGAVDLDEARAAAGPEFDKLDVDYGSPLDHKELGDRLSQKDGGDRRFDRDGTLTRTSASTPSKMLSSGPTRTAIGTVETEGGPGLCACERKAQGSSWRVHGKRRSRRDSFRSLQRVKSHDVTAQGRREGSETRRLTCRL